MYVNEEEVRIWVKQLEETNDLKQKSRSGRPTRLTPTQRRYLGQLEIISKSLGIPRSVPLLTEEAIKRRIAWAKAHQRKDWNSVIFSDESTFQMFRNTIQVRYKDGESIPSRPVVKHPFKQNLCGAVLNYY
ncbi:6491_t:CDS:2 [Diversispora eburnea]|uniref:6491_t:CDS:1 n=1 Tax=Diversispora eburnea TaxID=1213867 RepID=A0A9N8V6B1_9GLOM|nr:6491_t:CDS:2 [Diversispora eburnea]